jgi:hypothetical protein
MSADEGKHDVYMPHLGFHLLQLALGFRFRCLYGSRLVGTAAKFRVLLPKTSDFRLKVVCFTCLDSLILKWAFCQIHRVLQQRIHPPEQPRAEGTDRELLQGLCTRSGTRSLRFLHAWSSYRSQSDMLPEL